METRGKIIYIGSKKLDDLIEENSAIIIDLRDMEEFEYAHIKFAKNISPEKLEKEKDLLPNTKKIVIYCDMGATSAMCARMMAKDGFIVYNLVGGIQGYKGKYLIDRINNLH